ncbi:translation factor GTPase family protein [Actinoplanes sp. TBRC 11911]|uniref:elongation factor G n=1 Tax=Actinoplanes sp. TBRC 11911 TaxID=2729386 RepID=UPI0020071096|nr:TetM/TetW/TetO/TetS family tetracycline resistance ribosomal protection protein [Actinoplanes sp. TBRC 11911]
MSRTLNLGILAHVDAGKTTLTERLLYEAGAIGAIGRVDDGTTLTDSLDLERRRGITIRSAVASLVIGDVSVNIIDTPGHPDFIAEVDRVLGVLDGAVLVVSAVEGVQPQTRVLMRALRRLRVPTVMFINKIDRGGADVAAVLREIQRRLGVRAVPLTEASAAGTRAAAVAKAAPDGLIDALADDDEALFAAYVADSARVTPDRLWAALAEQTAKSLVCPVYAGSAMTGVGTAELMDGLVSLLPVAEPDDHGPGAGRIFKIERGAAGEKIAYVRMFSGALQVRDRVRDDADKVTGISVFERGAWVRRSTVRAGDIGKLSGLAHVRVGEAIGSSAQDAAPHHFAPPTLEARITPDRHDQHVALRAALAQLVEQDPLINIRSEPSGELSVSLYGEVQKEVIQATLAADYGIAVTFRETSPLYIERPVGVGAAEEILNSPTNPFHAAIGLRVEPASGFAFRLDVDYQSVPLYVYRNVDEFAAAMQEYVRAALGEGLYGWQVNDCLVTMISSNYSIADGPPSRRGPLATAADFRKLTPLVLMRALRQAGTRVCEPMSRARIDAPATSLGSVLGMLARHGAVIHGQSVHDGSVSVEADLPADRLPGVQRALPPVTNGDGVLESAFAGYQPVRGEPPSRRRTR